MSTRPARPTPRRGRRPLDLQAHPRDIWEQKKSKNRQFLLFSNIPAEGSNPCPVRNVPEKGAQNPFFKDFASQDARP